MNLLAHAYLSFNDPFILTGNMISDYVKGKKQYDYPKEIHNGIVLHRSIDEFTDQHPATKKAKQYFRNDYRLYAGAFIDVVFDHFLANDEKEFKNEKGLAAFSLTVYKMLNAQKDHLPLPFKKMLPYMESSDWLYNYRLMEGMRQSFGGLVRRSKYLNDSSKGFLIFENNYDELSGCYEEFFPSVKSYAAHRLSEIQNF